MSDKKQNFSTAAEASPVIFETLSNAKRVLICGHIRPDGDCLGSMTAMGLLLRALGKVVDYYYLGPVQSAFHDLAPAAAKETFPEGFEADVTLCLDSSGTNRFGEDFEPRGVVVNIDHHHDNSAYGDINWIGPQFAATGHMLVDFVEIAAPQSWTPQIANALYLALATDTGGFRFSNTTAKVFDAASLLVSQGASPECVANAVWGSRSRESLNIEAAVLGSISFECQGRLAWAEERWKMIEENGGEINEPDNLSSAIRGIRGVEIAILFRETSEGHLRASLRSRGDIDVSAIAHQFGGGGHPAAAGLTIEEPFDEARDKIVAAAVEAMEKE
jgi:bifunctional oligoribonuclease and PAP phosphatase NrnA